MKFAMKLAFAACLMLVMGLQAQALDHHLQEDLALDHIVDLLLLDLHPDMDLPAAVSYFKE